MKEDFLVWNFEAFREYLSYEVLRNAAQVLSLYENEDFNIKNQKIVEMQKLLAFRTNKNTWIPNRSAEAYININAEGDIYRNKGRLLTSMLLIYPKDLAENKVKLTKFGRCLAKGYINKKEFYNFIIINYKYPHPAYSDEYHKWITKGLVLLPFVLILQVLLKLNEYGENLITTSELAFFIYKAPCHNYINIYAKSIIDARRDGVKILVKSDDKITRKINDIFGFLLLSDYILQNKKGEYSLNLIHKKIIEDCITKALEKYMRE